MKHFRILYNGFIISIPVSVLCFQNEWLEMRMNVGHIGFTTMILLYISALYYEKKFENINMEKIFGSRNSFINILVCLASIYLIIGTERIKTLPAAIIREALYIRKVSFVQMNTGMLTILAVGILLIIISERNSKKIQILSSSAFKGTIIE